MGKFIERMIRAAKLDVNLYEEVEADKTAMGQATGVVILSSVAAGIGSISMGGGNLITVTIVALVGWYIWAYLTYIIGTKLLPEAGRSRLFFVKFPPVVISMIADPDAGVSGVALNLYPSLKNSH